MHAASQSERPVDIKVDKTLHELRITWSDQHISRYPLDALREACPCAACRGGHEFMGPEYDPDLTALEARHHYEVNDVQLVGNYALQFWWSDGHNAGIYSFGFLRRIDPALRSQSR